MKVNSSFILREIADEYVIIPVGAEAEKIKGILSLNAEGAFLWKLMESEQTEESLLRAVINEYEVEESTAQKDITIFLNELKRLGCLA